MPVVLLVTACTSTAGVTEPDPFAPTPTIGAGSAATGGEVEATTGPPVALQGALPDGTVFDVDLGANQPGDVEAVFATLIAESEAGNALLWGVAEPIGDRVMGDRWEEEGAYHLPAGDWLFRFVIDERLIGVLGDSYRDIIERRVWGRSALGFPVLFVSGPFRWATEDEATRHTQVLWHDFVVRRGCGPLAVGCSENGIAQLIPIPRVDRPLAPLPEDGSFEAREPLPEWYRQIVDNDQQPR